MLRQTEAEEEALCKGGNKEDKVKTFQQTLDVVMILSFDIIRLFFPLSKLMFSQHAHIVSVQPAQLYFTRSPLETVRYKCSFTADH